MVGMDYRNGFASKIKNLRIKSSKTQKEICELFCKKYNTDKKIAVSTWSSWEQGAKLPEVNTLINLAALFNVSVDYLLGISDDAALNNDDSLAVNSSISEIAREQLIEYDNKPVYLLDLMNSKKGVWTIYSFKDDAFYTPKKRITNNNQLRYYIVREKFIFGEKEPLSISEVKQQESVFVRYFAGTSIINRDYTGWYKHTALGDGLIDSVGRIIPYEGINVTYYAYSE